LATDDSIEHRTKSGDPNREICVPPQAPSGRKKAYHTYSPGVVLFEIGLWNSLPRKIAQVTGKPLQKASVDEVKSAMIATVDVLVHETGSICRDVTRTCLRGGFAQGIPEGDEELLAQAILTDIVVSLSSIKA
jgi:hypothetical protein